MGAASAAAKVGRHEAATQTVWDPALPKARPVRGRKIVVNMTDEEKKKEFYEWMKVIEDPCPLQPDVLDSVHKLLTE